MKNLVLLLALFLTVAPLSAQRGGSPASYKAPVLNEKYLAALGLANHKFTQRAEGVWQTDNGVTIYSSHPYGDDIKGFNGATPLLIAVNKAGKIVAVAPTANGESPDFWQRLVKANLFKAWNGLTLQKAAAKRVDAVSGATYSSKAVIQTVQATVKKIRN